MNGDTSSANWLDLPAKLKDAIPKANNAGNTDEQLKAFTVSDAITGSATFGIKSAGSDKAILITVTNGKADIQSGTDSKALFVLSALPEHWQEFFKQTPVAPYQSFWGMFGMNVKQKGVTVEGDEIAFATWAHVWRRVLELLHDAYAGPTPEDTDPEDDEDHITGRYTYITSPLWGKCKVFYEQSGTGPVEIVFLHTAGSDSRQYHGVLNDARMRERCRMTAFDLPAHGRSFPYENYFPGKHTTTEDAYIGCIAALVAKLGLSRPIICGASMAGQISLAAAARADEVGAGGAIPLQGSDYLHMQRQWNDRSPYVNQALYAPEWIYGMMSPNAPLKNRQLVWHTYSSGAYGIFHGDLDMYFGGWDGRERMKGIDTKKCPVHMLTGEYDWSGTPELGKATAQKIPGAEFTVMKNLGHFPMTENPKLFVGYLLDAIDHVQKTRA